DPANWIALEFLGLAHMDLKQFPQAKKQFAEVLLLTPDSTVSIEGLMVSAYLTGDANTACAMAEQLRRIAATPNPEFVRSSIAVYASCGKFEQAERMREQLAQRGQTVELERTDRRLAQWRSFYQRQDGAARMLPAMLTGDAETARPLQLAQAFTPPKLTPRPTPLEVDDAASPTTAATAPSPASDPSATAAAAPSPSGSEASGPRMRLIDVVLLSMQALVATSKGVTLLNALASQLGSVAGNLPAFSRSVTSTTVGDAAPSTTTAITRAVTVPALAYSLNIANANNAVNEVLARPTLAAIEGLASEFFSGTNLSAG